MPAASFRFYGALNDFLPALRRQGTLVCAFEAGASVKDLVEALGVPHPEIDRLIVNGEPVDFAYLVRDGDRVAAFPPFRVIDAGPEGRLGPALETVPRFVADVHLGRLAAYLRLAGFDTLYRNDYADPELASVSHRDDRTLLTRDVGLLKHRLVIRGYFVRETEPGRQLIEVVRRFDLAHSGSPFTRCVRCNHLLGRVTKEEVLESLPPRTREHYCEFSRCGACGRVYWQGSHYARMAAFLDEVFAAAARPQRS